MASSSSAVRPSRSPSMMRWLSRFSTGQPERSSFSTACTFTSAKISSSLCERVVVLVAVGQQALGAAPVVDEVEADVALLVGDARQRHDLGGVDDGGVEAVLDALVDEHRVEDVAGGRVEAEAHVGDAERGVDAGDLLLDAAVIASMVAMASWRRSSSPVESGKVSVSKMRSVRLEAVGVGGEVDDALGDPHLPLDVAGLALLVDQQADDRGAVVAGPA